VKKAIKWGYRVNAPLAGAALALTLGTIGGCNKSGTSGGSSGIIGGGGGGGGDVVANVNGQAISREELRTAAEATAGEQTLQQLIDYNLVMQKAKAAGVEVSDPEVDKFLEDRKEENPELVKMIENGGAQLEELRRRVRSQVAVDKMLTKDIKVTDAELQKWFEKRRASYDKPEQVKIGIIFASTKTRADILEKQLKSKTRSFKELVDEQKKTKDAAGQQSSEAIPKLAPLSTLDAKTAALIKPLKEGDIAPMTTFGQGPQAVHAIIRLVERQAATKADFAALKPELEMEYKLEQVARQEAKANPQTANFDKTKAETKKMLEQQGPVTERQVINTLNRAAVQRLLTESREGAKVDIPDKSYVHLADAYKAAPAMPDGGAMMAPGGAAPGGAAPGGAAPGGAAPGGAAPGGAAPGGAAPGAGAPPPPAPAK